MEKISSIVANAKTAATIAEGKIKAGITQVDYLHGKISEGNEKLAQTEEKLVETCEGLQKAGEKIKDLESQLSAVNRDILKLTDLVEILLCEKAEAVDGRKNAEEKAATLLANINCARDALKKGISADKFWARGDAKNIFEEVIKILGKNNETDHEIGGA
ncbi:MAG: hypothetical protein WCV70_02670 [Patescibacteria group bacterium]|jgi:chromosome segregation ATPase